MTFSSVTNIPQTPYDTVLDLVKVGGAVAVGVLHNKLHLSGTDQTVVYSTVAGLLTTKYLARVRVDLARIRALVIHAVPVVEKDAEKVLSPSEIASVKSQIAVLSAQLEGK